MLTLQSRIIEATKSQGTVTFISGDDAETISWAALHHDATALAAKLAARGIAPGSHVGLLGPTTRTLVTTIQAVWLAGGTLVMLPLPMRMGSLDQFIEQTRSRIAAADVDLVVIDPLLAELYVAGPGDATTITYDELASTEADVAGFEFPPDDPDALAVLQFTSGSTSDPKGVMLLHRQICSNIDACYEAAEMQPSDVVVSWLPLYHDMGLIGLMLIPMSTGVGLVQGAPQDFLSRPARWLQWISEYGGTATAGPNFSFALATRALRRAEGLDLSSLAICLNGAEPVDSQAFAEFFAAGERFGLSSDSAFSAFGMAELCIGGSFPKRGGGLRSDVVDGEALERDRVAVPVDRGHPHAKELAFLGKAVPGLELRIIRPNDGQVCADREVGELQIRGTSVTSGYYNQPDATAALIHDGWLHTGDLAYLVDGEMVMCGRIKDVIIIGGRNIYPHDIERVVGDTEGVRKGNVIAFGQEGLHGKQHIIVVAETREEDREALAKIVSRRVTDGVGVPPRAVVLVDPGTIPKTSSGKLQRVACRARYEAGEYTQLSD